MRRLTFLLLLAVAVPAAPAVAGGWASVELGAAPGGLSTDTPWRVQLIVKAHGRTPMDGLAPRVQIRNDEGVVRTFPARPAGRTGTYVADVRFPSAGTWRTRIFDGYTDAVPHRIAPLIVAPAGKVGPPAQVAPDRIAPVVAPPANDGGLPWPQITAIGVLVLLWLGALAWVGGGTFRLGVARDRRRTASGALAGGPPARP